MFFVGVVVLFFLGFCRLYELCEYVSQCYLCWVAVQSELTFGFVTVYVLCKGVIASNVFLVGTVCIDTVEL